MTLLFFYRQTQIHANHATKMSSSLLFSFTSSFIQQAIVSIAVNRRKHILLSFGS